MKNEGSDTIRVLHVDDEPDFAEVAATFIERVDDRLTVATESNVAEGLERLSQIPFDCIVSDHDMPGRSGIDFLEAVRHKYPDLPFILYTGKGSEEIASDAISAGVTDYLQKEGGTDQYTVLANRIVNASEAYRAERDLKRRNRQHEAIATLSRAALEEVSLQALLDSAVELVADRVDSEYAKVLELSSDQSRLRLVAGAGWGEELIGTATVGTGQDSQAGYALSQSEPVVVEDFRTEERFRIPELLADHDVRSGISVVIGSKDDPWGVLEAHVTDADASCADDVQFVQNVANIIGTAIEQYETAQRLRESEAQFREIAELSPDTIFRLDTDGEFTYASPAVESLLGYTPADVRGTNFREYVPPESLSDAVDGFARVCDGDVVRKLELTLSGVDAERSRVEVELSATPVRDDGEVVVVQGFAREITDRKEREHELVKVRDLLDQTESLADVGGWEIDTDTRSVFWTQHLYEILGVEYDDEPPLEEALSIYHEDDRLIVERAVTSALDAGDPFNVEARFRRPDGEMRWLRVQGVPTIADGEVVALRGAVQDITDWKTSEQELERQNSRLDEFVSVVSHDLRNPLNVATGQLELAREECDSDHLESVARAHDRMNELIENLLTLTRDGDRVGDVELVDLAGVVKSCWENVTTAEATLNTASDVQFVADPSRLKQLIENLVCNAVEHGGPTVTVTVGKLDDGFYLEDDGSGIAAEHKADVFEAGYSTAVDGTGFGLRIAKQVADAHGWEIHLTEEASGGTRFEVRGVERTQLGPNSEKSPSSR